MHYSIKHSNLINPQVFTCNANSKFDAINKIHLHFNSEFVYIIEIKEVKKLVNG